MRQTIETLLREYEQLSNCRRSQATLRSYGSDWRNFCDWCRQVGRDSLPASPETVALYLTQVISDNRKITTAARRAAAINYYHREADLALPRGRVQRLLEGAQRLKLERPVPKKPVSVEQLRQICQITSRRLTRQGVRDHSILTLGFSSALRRSNIVALQLNDIEFVAQGITIRVRREKQDQLGQGRMIGIACGKYPETCPVRAAKMWVDVRGPKPGALYTSMRGERMMCPQIVADVVKDAVKLAGLDPKEYAAHSLRAGFITEAVLNGVHEMVIATQSGHRSMDSLRRYVRITDLFRKNPSGQIGL